MAEEQSLGRLFEQSAAILTRLRAPGGCPWDREQTPESIRKYTLEETYEVLDAIERRDWPNLCEELGDLLLQVLFYAQMAEEAGHFQLSEVLNGLNRKLVRRHPHVFGEEAAAKAGNKAANLLAVAAKEQADAASAVIANWNAIKQLEKKAKAKVELRVGESARPGYLHDVLRAQSASAEAVELSTAAARAGFDWPHVQGILTKVREEVDEVEAEVALREEPGVNERLADEVGDLLFTTVNLARHLRVDAEMALRDANAKFRRRFEAMEKANERLLETLTAEELEQAWAAAKLVTSPTAKPQEAH